MSTSAPAIIPSNDGGQRDTLLPDISSKLTRIHFSFLSLHHFLGVYYVLEGQKGVTYTHLYWNFVIFKCAFLWCPDSIFEMVIVPQVASRMQPVQMKLGARKKRFLMQKTCNWKRSKAGSNRTVPVGNMRKSDRNNKSSTVGTVR